MNTVGVPGAQATVTGVQGIGVSTPSANAVAAITVGLSIDVHMVNGGMLGSILSIMFAPGDPATITVGSNTLSDDGKIPKVHVRIEPAFAQGPGMMFTP